MNVSPSFSPSIGLMKPYFLLAPLLYLLSMVTLFFTQPFSDMSDFHILASVHIYMLGFVMLSIFAAMAQLGPIVVETQHAKVDVFRFIWIFLTLGLALMLMGFYANVVFLPLGGFFVLIAMGIYALEFLLTLKNARRKTAITHAMKMSNLFLLLGILSGITMALGLSGLLHFNPHTLLKTHTFGLLVGFVIMLIMGISIVLIPMFGMAKRVSDNDFYKSFITLSIGVVSMLLSPFFFTDIFESLSYIFTLIAIVLYFYQLYTMRKSQRRATKDIWEKSVYVGFFSFIISFFLLLSYLIMKDESLLRLGMWVMMVGFFGFLIMGNFYKIVPFLVWFQIYSPLIETRSVPMLHDLVPQRAALMQWFYSLLGLILSSIGIILESEKLFFGGVSMLLFGGFIFFIIINKILKANL